MKVDRHTMRQDFHSEQDGGTLSVYYTNRGEPYRDGIEISFDDGPFVFLENFEARLLRDFLIKMYPL